jgi:hypothetical protein
MRQVGAELFQLEGWPAVLAIKIKIASLTMSQWQDFQRTLRHPLETIRALPGWGAKSSAAVLAKFGHLEAIPADGREWRVNAANASALADNFCRERDRAMLFRTLATLRTDIRLFTDVDELRWDGPTAAFDVLAARLDGAVTKRLRPGVRRVPKRADSQT